MVGGGVAAALIWLRKFLKDIRSDARANSDALDERERAWSERVEERLIAANQKNERLTEENIQLRIEAARKGTPPVDVLKAMIMADPGIIWAKVREFDDGGKSRYRMVLCSFTFCRIFLTGGPEQYENKLDSEIWPEDIARTFQANDELTYLKQRGIDVREPVRGSPSGIVGTFVGRKFPLSLPDGKDYIIGTGVLEQESKPQSVS